MLFFIISIILIVFLSLLFLPLKVIASAEGKDAIVVIKLAGMKMFKFLPGKNKNSEEKPQKSSKEIVEDIEDKSQSLCDKIKFYSNLSKTAVKLTRKYVLIENISLKIDVGTSDAPSTAICTGALWSVIYQILGIIGSVMYINENHVEVNPDFNNARFSAKGKCIIKSRLAYIIIIAIVMFIKINSLKGKED